MHSSILARAIQRHADQVLAALTARDQIHRVVKGTIITFTIAEDL